MSLSLIPETNSFLFYSFRDTPDIASSLSIQYSSEFLDIGPSIVSFAFLRLYVDEPTLFGGMREDFWPKKSAPKIEKSCPHK
jgi:hypothetical protein